MKKSLLLASLFFSLLSFAQKRNTVIEIDLSEPKKETITVKNGGKKDNVQVNQLEFHYKNSLSFNFINGNPLKYTYKIKNNLVNIFEESNLNIFDKSQISPKVEAQIKADIIEADSITLNEKKKVVQTFIVQDYFKNFNINNIEINSTSNNFSELSKKNKPQKAIVDVNYLLSSIRKQNKKIVSDKLNTLADKSKNLDNQITLFIQNSKVQKSLDKDDFESQRDVFYVEYVNIVSEYKVLEKIITEKELINAENLKKIKSNEEINSKIEENLKILFKVNFDNYSLPIDVTGKNIDLVEVTLEIYDKEKNELIESHPYRIWIRGGIKIDVSGGLYFTSLVDDEFFTEDDPNNTDEKIIRQKDLGKFDFGFGSLLNIRFRNGKDYTLVANVGAMLKADQDFQFLTGLGLSFGRDERLIFNAGLAMGRVDRLQSNLQVGNSYNLGDSNTVSVVKKFDIGCFFGVSYNFSKPKSDKSKTE
ncbi:hypothetical protein [Polaribacter porphyrae]|uniref:Outer membrane protein beta-barrel domain-containing protein n=1 Tax=Polaribacter porphyrae TaxID=1137780 RepID=A0A2S7WMK0_9FLAO|nr:hypothetical protein [Polaribacter porphyrae]PQJ78501.1 hypothetical protein BTO18_04550 [Polaribacter porphyrae]